jgi:hypothetical protein
VLIESLEGPRIEWRRYCASFDLEEGTQKVEPRARALHQLYLRRRWRGSECSIASTEHRCLDTSVGFCSQQRSPEPMIAC